MRVVSCTFTGSHKSYDYFCDDDTVRVGDNAIVETRRGDATVIVVAVKDHSDRATAHIKRLVKPNINTLF